MTTNNQASTNTTSDIVVERVFNAPRELVWKAFTEPEHFKRWWGPKDFTTPFAKIDLRVGGKYVYSMQSDDGQLTYATGTYREVTPMDRLVFTDSFSDEHGTIVSPTVYGMGDDFPWEMVITVTLEDAAGGTKLTLRQEGLPAGEMKEMMPMGWNESLDKLEASLR